MQLGAILTGMNHLGSEGNVLYPGFRKANLLYQFEKRFEFTPVVFASIILFLIFTIRPGMLNPAHDMLNLRFIEKGFRAALAYPFGFFEPCFSITPSITSSEKWL